MHLGRTSLRLTSRLAAGRRRRKLRDDLKVSRQVVAGETSFVVNVPESGVYLRYTALMWTILTQFDGTRTDREVWEEVSQTFPELQITLGELQELADGAEPSLWERTLTERNLALLEKIRGERRQRARGRQSVFHLSFSAWDPDRFFRRVLPWLRFLWTPGFAAFSVVLMAIGAVLFAADHERIFRDTAYFYAFGEQSLGELVDFWVLLLLVSFIHECAHGLTASHYGGEVHQMGFMLIYFTPAFYTDVSDMYLFDRDRKRFFTILAGVWIETVLCAAALVAWSVAPPGTSFSYWSYKLMLMTSITGVLFNLNPLMKFDGYYLLCQILKIDNLREDSFAYLRDWALHLLTAGRHSVPGTSRRRQRIFLLFGSLALGYSVLVTTLVVLFVRNVMTSKFGGFGIVLTAGFVWVLLRRRIKGALRAAAGAWTSLRQATKRWRPSRPSVLLAGGAAVAFLALPTRVRVTSDFVLEPSERLTVRASVPGTLREVGVREGEPVAAGAVLGVLEDPDLEASARVLDAKLRLADRRMLAAQASSDYAATREHEAQRRRIAAERERATARLAALTLQAPIAGIVASPGVEQRVGEYLREGQELCVVANGATMRARVLVRDAELEEVRPGATVLLKVAAFPLATFHGRVERVLPAAASPSEEARPATGGRPDLFNYFVATLEFANPDGRLREGMTGTAKIYGRRFSPLVRLTRSAWRWARSEVWF
jgi:putative peptide zinc metalloprotease protein